MAQPAGEAESDALRLDFDHRLKLEFHGSSVTSERMCHHHGRSASQWRGKEPNQRIEGRFGRLTRRERRESCVDRLWLSRNPAE